MEVSKKDWDLYKEKIRIWQEKYMEKLAKDYIDILSSDEAPSVKFHELETRINEDKHSPGVEILLKKSEMIYQLKMLIIDKVIDRKDMLEFSSELQDEINECFGWNQES